MVAGRHNDVTTAPIEKRPLVYGSLNVQSKRTVLSEYNALAQ